MRYDEGHKAETRSRIVKSAARIICSKGPGNVAVADIMAGAGLTHGGFYAHFATKDALVVEALDVMFSEGPRPPAELDETIAYDASDARASLGRFLTGYLSAAHRDQPDKGCPLPALSADIARNAGAAQDRFALGVGALTAWVEAILKRLGADHPDVEARAVVSQIAGAVGLARAVGKGDQSDAILRDNLNVLSARYGL